MISNIYFKLSPLFVDATSGIIFSRMSDHFPYLIGLKPQGKHNAKKTRLVNCAPIRSGTRALLESLRNANVYSELLDDNPCADPNINYNKLHSCILELKERHLSYKLVKFNNYKHKGNKRITNRIIEPLKFRDKLYKGMKSLAPSSSFYLRQSKTYPSTFNCWQNRYDKLKLYITIKDSTKIDQICAKCGIPYRKLFTSKRTIILA